jgi:hypothetical protein
MRVWKCSIWACALLLGGCKNDSSTAFLIEQPVTTRPIVAIIPVIDKSRHPLAWNVSNELTTSIRQRLTQHGQLYLLSEDQSYAMARKYPLSENGKHDPFGLDTTWIKKGSFQNEFVAFFELVDHREVPLQSDKEADREESPAELNLSMRIRVFDLRGKAPKVVLEEMIAQSHHIPRQFTQEQASSESSSSSQISWGSELFEISPLGIAHEKLCQEIASRVEDYILLNCKS